jgi:hypothetical protein
MVLKDHSEPIGLLKGTQEAAIIRRRLTLEHTIVVALLLLIAHRHSAGRLGRATRPEQCRRAARMTSRLEGCGLARSCSDRASPEVT